MTNEEMAQVLESEARLHEGKASLYEKQLSGCDRLGSDREAAIRGMAKRQRDRAACLKAGAAALRALAWKDGLPGDPVIHQEYMVWRADAGIFAALFHIDDEDGIGRWFARGGHEDLTGDLPTKHMPLPAPPEWPEKGGGK